MCNSSLIFNNSALFIDENTSWFCMCKGHLGTLVVIYTLILCFTVGTPLHCWSLWIFLHGNFKSNMVFPLSMTILELLFCIQCFADIFDYVYGTTTSYNLSTFLIGLIWTTRPILQIYVCIERYLAVIHPMIFLRYKAIQYRIALVIVGCLIAVGNGIRLVSIRRNYFRDHVFFLVFCIVVLITSFCCASVLRALKHPGPGDQNNVEVKDRHNKTDRGRAVGNQQKRKAFTIISHVLMSILVCYLPIVIVYFICIPGVSKPSFLCNVVPLILILSKIALLISPLVRMYREGFLKHMICSSKLGEQMKGNRKSNQ